MGFIPEEFAPMDEFASETLYPNSKELIKTPGKEEIRSSIEADAKVPIKIIIDAIGVNSSIQNPDTKNVRELDEFLKRGVVRYPGSGFLGQGNMFLFAHSTSIKVVHNQAYKAFNNLDKLNKGDEIRVQSKDREYVYRVSSVRLVDESRALVEFDTTRNMLTLSTCNTFGEKQQRFVVEAGYKTSYPLK